MSQNKHDLNRAVLALTGLAQVEATIKSKILSEAALLSEIGSYLLNLGGKRIRPILTLMMAKAFGLDGDTSSPAGQQLIDAAAGIELIHMATLLHDDIIDKSAIRRHNESPLARYGADNTLLTGDFLLVRAFGLCARLDRYIIDATEAACVALTEGEILETSLTKQSHSLDSSLDIARRKTAALFKLAAQVALHLAGGSPSVVEDMAQFGEQIGIAFQIVDDVLDVVSSEDLLGKKTGQDLRERKPSVVNVLWLKTKSKLSERLLYPPGRDEDLFIHQALQEIKASPVIAEAKDLAKSFAKNGLLSLHSAVRHHTEHDKGIIDQPTLSSLSGLVQYVLDRMN